MEKAKKSAMKAFTLRYSDSHYSVEKPIAIPNYILPVVAQTCPQDAAESLCRGVETLGDARRRFDLCPSFDLNVTLCSEIRRGDTKGVFRCGNDI